jgi:hypothetical protein
VFLEGSNKYHSIIIQMDGLHQIFKFILSNQKTDQTISVALTAHYTPNFKFIFSNQKTDPTIPVALTAHHTPNY